MKIQLFVSCLMLLPFLKVSAQSKFCDELVQVGDTFICEDFIGKSIVPAREHYYLFGNLIFSRRWYYLYMVSITGYNFEAERSMQKGMAPLVLFTPMVLQKDQLFMRMAG